VGTLRADQAIVLKPEISGRVVAFNFTEGQSVKKGQVLITLDGATYDAQLKQAQANLTLSNLNYQRIEQVFKKNLVSANDHDTAYAKKQSDAAQVALAQAQFDKTQLKAPFDGIAGLREVNIGDIVSVGQNLMNVVALDPIKVDFKLPEQSLPNIAVGQTLSVEVDSLPGKTFSGFVSAIDPQIDAVSHSVMVRGVVDNHDLILRPGLFAKVKIMMQSHNTFLVPEQAIVPQGDKQTVFKIVDGKAVQVPVVLGEHKDGKVEVKSGLHENDRVISAAKFILHEGMAVVNVIDVPKPGDDSKK
jgi:membrane fusion protein (multidrug efflux system)